MKIAVAGTRGFPGVQGGVENHCEKLYARLAEKGCAITVFTRKPYVDSNITAYKGVSLVPINCTKNKFLEAIIHTFKGVLKARNLDPDILHIHAIGPSLFAPLARILGMRVVVTNHGPDYERKKWPLPARLFLKSCERMGAVFANGIIAISENIAVDIRRKYNRDAFVLPNGVDIPETAITDNILEKFGLVRNKYILAVGRLVPEKGFHDLIEAFNGLKQDLNETGTREWKLVIAGDADHADNYSKCLKAEADKNSNIVLTGFLTGQPLKELYSHAGLFVLPSYHEGLPIVLLEAMSYGLPCIASDIPANRNVELGGNSFFQAGDVNSLKEKMREFINKLWTDVDKESQRALINSKYNWDNIAEETLEVYKKILKVN